MHDYVTNSISFAFARAQETGLLIVQWLILRVSVRRVSVGRMMWPTTPASLARLSQAFFLSFSFCWRLSFLAFFLSASIFISLPCFRFFFCFWDELCCILTFQCFSFMHNITHVWWCLQLYSVFFVSVNGRNNHDWNICIPHSVIIIILKNVDVTVVFFTKTNKPRIN